MNFQDPPTLQHLAVQGLLRDEVLAISSLQHLPRLLLLPLFKEAFAGRFLKTLKAMVAAWPYPWLPVGSLMKTPDLEILKAVLDGLDMLLTQVWPRGCKLKAVDFQARHHNFWNEWAGAEDLGCSPQVVRKEQKLEDIPRPEMRQPLKIIVDLCLKFHKLDGYHTYLLQWAKLRKSSLQLCCRKLQIWVLPVYTIIEILKVFEPECIQELELNSWWQLGALAWFAPYLGQMRNLRKFLIAGVCENTSCIERIVPERKYVNKFISQFSKLSCLQNLYMNRVYFLTGQMKHLVWCLKSPLETLSITLCQFTYSDMNHLSQCQSLWQLKHLNLSGVPLYLCSKPFRLLLESVTATLQTLELEGCGLEDSNFSALLPVLNRCSQLTKVNFCDNDISVLILKDLLLYHTANLSQLTHELYPAPLECYDYGQLTQLCSPLMSTLRAIRQPKKVNFATEVCPKCNKRCVYNLDTRLCPCWQSD